MNRRSKFFHWYKAYKQNKKEWLDWLEANAHDYKSTEDAWIVFAAKRQIDPAFLNVETDFRHVQ